MRRPDKIMNRHCYHATPTAATRPIATASSDQATATLNQAPQPHPIRAAVTMVNRNTGVTHYNYIYFSGTRLAACLHGGTIRRASKPVILASIVAVFIHAAPLQKPSKTGRLINGKPKIEMWVPDLVGVDLDASKANRSVRDLDEIPPARPPKPAERSNCDSKPQLVVNENASTTTPDTAEKIDNNNTGAAPINTQGPATQTQGNSIAHPYWYPVCLFIDQSISESDGNDAAKGLAEAGHQCGVNVVVFPVTIANSFSEQH